MRIVRRFRRDVSLRGAIREGAVIAADLADHPAGTGGRISGAVRFREHVPRRAAVCEARIKDPAEQPAEGAPEKYEDFKLPEGTAFDSAVAQKFSEVAKELNLSQEKAQSVVDKMLPIMRQRQLEQIQAISDGWRQKSESTPEIVDHIADVARLRDRFAFNEDGTMDPDIQEFMASPAGNHPGCLKLLARAGRAFGESGFPKGQPAPRKLTASDVYR